MLAIYDELGTHEGFTMIRLSPSGLYNFLTPDKRLLSEESFVDAGPFKEGFAPVQRLDKKWYFLKSDGTFISECNGFFRAYCFHEGFAEVHINEDLGFNFVNQTGTLISNENYGEAYPFCNGFARVLIKGKGWNFLKKDGTLLCETYFINARDFKGGRAWVQTQDMHTNLIKEDGTIIVVEEEIFYMEDFSEGFANISNAAHRWNYIDTDGKIISKRWFLKAYPFKNGFGMVAEKQGCNFVTPSGSLLCEKWFSDASFFTPDGVAAVEFPYGTYNFVKSDGTFLSEKWFDYAIKFDEGFAFFVCLNNKCNFLQLDGTMLFEEWLAFDELCK